MNSIDRLWSKIFSFVMIDTKGIMTNTKGIMTIIAIATILITGGFVISPYAYSSGYNDDSNGKCNDDSHDDSNGDCVPDPCDCERPDTFKVRYVGPGDFDNPATVEIYKKTKHAAEDKTPILTQPVYVGDPNIPDEDFANQIIVSKSHFNKDKLNSNIGYVILWDDDLTDDPTVPGQGLEEIAKIDIHVSCSDEVQMLYIGQTFTDGLAPNTVTLTVEDGTRGGETSIPKSDPLTCEADEQPTPMTSITVKKALTNDNNGQAGPEDFTVTLTEIGDDGLVGTADDVPVEPQTFDADESSFSVTIPSGTYFMIESVSEEFVDKYTTVMITGDTACPSMEEEPFKLKKDTHITCTIYNDDNFVEDDGGVPGGSGGPGDGFFFARHSVEISVNEFSQFDEGTSPNRCDVVPDGFKTPCVKEGPGSGQILLVDEAFEEEGADLAAVIITLQPVSASSIGECTGVIGIGEHPYKKLDGTLDTPTKGLIINCPGLVDPGIFKLNYAIMKTIWVPVPGDGIDNDMDGMIDEDPLDGTDTNVNGIIDLDERIDTDNDGLIDEDT